MRANSNNRKYSNKRHMSNLKLQLFIIIIIIIIIIISIEVYYGVRWLIT